MKKRLSALVVSLSLIATGLLAVAVPAQPAFAQVNVFNTACGTGGANGTTSGKTICGANDGKALPDLVKIIINVMLFIVGIIAVIMIVIGGVKYVVSNGDSAQLQSAKNTVLYSVVGLVIAVSAYAIVNFVLDNFK